MSAEAEKASETHTPPTAPSVPPSASLARPAYAVPPEFLPDHEPGLVAAVKFMAEWVRPGEPIPRLALGPIAVGMVRAVDRARREAAPG